MNFFKMYKVEQKIFFRSPDVIIFNLLMPLVVFILISMISGSKEAGTLTFSQSSYIALSTVGICCSAFMSIPISIVESRSHGILRRLYCSPCSRTTFSMRYNCKRYHGSYFNFDFNIYSSNFFWI